MTRGGSDRRDKGRRVEVHSFPDCLLVYRVIPSVVSKSLESGFLGVPLTKGVSTTPSECLRLRCTDPCHRKFGN